MAYSDAQIMMTLASLANISTAPRPSGVETLSDQAQRIQDGINGMLNNKNITLATDPPGNWKAVWVGLSQTSGEDANLSYIATDNSTPPNVAVVVRGTTDAIEMAEDSDAKTQVSFSAGKVSQGFNEAFTYITGAIDVLTTATSLGQITLLQALQALGGTGSSLTSSPFQHAW